MSGREDREGFSARGETGELRRVLVHEPGTEIQSVIDPDARDWDGLPRLKRVVKEHHELVAELEARGVEVVELGDVPEKLADALFVRDVGFAVEGGTVVGRMAGPGRRGEEHVLTERMVGLGTPIYHTVHGPGRFEAGNAVWLDRETVVVGRSRTANAAGIAQIRNVLDTYGIDVIEVPLFGSTKSSGRTHLALVFGMVATDLALVYPQAVPTDFRDRLESRGIETIEVGMREQRNRVTSSVVTEPGRVLLAAGNPETADKLRAKGVDVTELDVREIGKAGGGLKGLVLPLKRADP